MLDYKFSLRGLAGDTAEFDTMKKGCHQRAADKLLTLARANGGLWIKVGQHLGSLEYLLPTEYTNTLKILHCGAPQAPLSDVKQVILEELHMPVDELFSEFSDIPVGAASLAQVHRGVLKDGRIVAVKVQHRRVKAHSFVDMVTMEVPEIMWPLTTNRVLMMEFCEGGQVNDMKFYKNNHIPPHEVASKLGQLFSDMIFMHGFVHCDPHPGNILVNKDKAGKLQIVLLDHGLYTTLHDDFRLSYANLWLAILKADEDGIKKWSSKMGVGDLYGLFACMVTARSWASVTKGIDKSTVSEQENAEIAEYVGSLLSQISNVLSRVPPPMLLIFKTNDLIRGIERSIKVEKEAVAFVEMTKCCIRSIYNVEYRNCTNPWMTLRLIVTTNYALFTIGLYEMWLYCTRFFIRIQ